jgi:hypothetical protein
MRFYTRQHKHYCGIDLHARAMYVCILDQSGTILVHKNLPTTPEAFLRIIAPYREDLVVANASSHGLGWRSSVPKKALPLFSGMPSIGRRFMGAKPRPISLRPTRLPGDGVAGCCPKPLSIPPKCAPPGLCCAAAVIGGASAPNG